MSDYYNAPESRSFRREYAEKCEECGSWFPPGVRHTCSLKCEECGSWFPQGVRHTCSLFEPKERNHQQHVQMPISINQILTSLKTPPEECLHVERRGAAFGKSERVAAQDPIAAKCDQVKNLLLQKNADYGNSALNPLRIFSKADAEEQIRVRIDDKLSRLAGAGEKNFTEDTVMDLIGYLILLAVKMEEVRPCE